MSKIEDERMWFLDRCWGRHGWSSHPWRGIRKWDNHVLNLVKRGLLEEDDSSNWRITDLGVQTLIASLGDRVHPDLIDYAQSSGLLEGHRGPPPEGLEPC